MGTGECWQCQDQGEAVIGHVAADELKASGCLELNLMTTQPLQGCLALKQQMTLIPAPVSEVFVFIFMDRVFSLEVTSS